MNIQTEFISSRTGYSGWCFWIR